MLNVCAGMVPTNNYNGVSFVLTPNVRFRTIIFILHLTHVVDTKKGIKS